MTNLFKGREAHDGDDHAVLDRWDRRVATTISLYLSALIPALVYDDVGIVLAWTGTVSATALTYIGPGILFIGVHGQEFLDLVESKWGALDSNDSPSFWDRILWYLLLMPLWCKVASVGKRGLAYHYARKEMMTPGPAYRLGNVKHKNRNMIIKQKQMRSKDDILNDGECDPKDKILLNSIDGKLSAELGLITATDNNTKSYGSIVSNVNSTKSNEIQDEVVDAEEDPQDENQTVADFVVAIGFVVFGMVAFTAGVVSICTH